MFTFSQLVGPSPQLLPPIFLHCRLVYCSGGFPFGSFPSAGQL
ncbi:hypothetical protein BUC_4198 [Burkholderia pseudomallei 576]|nr:hypothetical protein BUC_4198 [Burkholderia pseudomallei 576]